MPFRFGPWEIGLILVVILIIFGVGKLPQVGGAIGKGLREFRKARSGIDEVVKLANDEPASRSRKQKSN
jgi:sec-independent protein translocase protein TatA